MKLALLNIIKPIRGSGDGITEYTYQLYNKLNRKTKVDRLYAIEESKRNNISGLIRANLQMRERIRSVSCQYDLFHVTNQEIGFVSKLLKGRCTAPVITTIHDISRFDPKMHNGVLQGAYNRMVKSYIKDAVMKSDFLIFDSELTLNEVRKKFDVGKNSKVVNIGVKESLIESPKHKSRDTEKFTVGYIGSFAYHKNVRLMLEAANIIDESHYAFKVYGNGVEYKRLEQYINANNLKAAKLMGFAPEDRIVEIYDSFNVFVFPSLYEGFGLPILEAQARGLPVIIYKKGKISDEVRKYCFEAESAAHMASIISDIRENGYDEKLRMEATRYARGFTWSKCAKETLKTYEKVLESQ